MGGDRPTAGLIVRLGSSDPQLVLGRSTSMHEPAQRCDAGHISDALCFLAGVGVTRMRVER